MKKADRASQKANHPLQSEAWGEFRQNMGVDVAHAGAGLITFHTIPHTPWTIGYFPKGPMPTHEMITELTKLGREKNAVFIQLEPNVVKTTAISRQLSATLRPAHHPLFTKYTFVLDLTKTEAELLAAMHPKTRYNIRVAQKHNVNVTEDNSKEAFEEYLRLSAETTARQGFYAHNETYQRRMWDIMHKAGIAKLFLARYESKPLVAWICFIWGDTMYYPYGASSTEHRNVMAPTLMLWEVALWAKKHGLKHFDLWGAMAPPKAGKSINTKDPFYGFHRFKEGFGPHLVEFVGSYDLVISPLLYPLYKVADVIRWTLLKLRN